MYFVSWPRVQFFMHGEFLVPQKHHGSMVVSMGSHSNHDNDKNHKSSFDDETTSREFYVSECECNGEKNYYVNIGPK